MSTVYILGVIIDDISSDDGLKQVEGVFADSEDQLNYIVTPNPEICVYAANNNDYREKILNKAFLSLPDGFGLKIGAMILKQRLKHRITGIDFTLALMNMAEKKRWSVFLFGGQAGIAQKAKVELEKKYPHLKIACLIDGDETDADHKLVIEQINRAKPCILLVALGAPKQERWIASHGKKLKTVRIAIGVGGTFDFIAGRVKRAPSLMRTAGLEWVWRLLIQPWRIRRIYNATLKFFFTVILWRVRMAFVYRQNVVGLIVRGGSSVGRTSASQAEDRGFKSPPPLHILLVERKDEERHFQLPQGGVEKEETPDQAILREMKEELGTDKLAIAKHIKNFYSYRWPLLDQLRRGYHGQRQDLFVLEFTGTDDDIVLDQREHVSFKWVQVEEAVDAAHPVRQNQVARAIKFLSNGTYETKNKQLRVY